LKIYDENLILEKLMGTNKAYLEKENTSCKLTNCKQFERFR
ncbi:unnamed protein product, partial [marine sediment metagenome]